jgi:mono/diheme cytochrome c family protein
MILIYRIAVSLMVLLTLFFSGCDYGRMYDQDAVKTYSQKMKPMDSRTVPVSDGFVALSNGEAATPAKTLPQSAEIIEQGRVAYEYFCVQCHGSGLDGRGTVGQSFVSLPTDLTSPTVLSESDGLLYKRIRLGYKRHPALFTTLSTDDAWAVIVYVRSKGGGH